MDEANVGCALRMLIQLFMSDAPPIQAPFRVMYMRTSLTHLVARTSAVVGLGQICLNVPEHSASKRC